VSVLPPDPHVVVDNETNVFVALQRTIRGVHWMLPSGKSGHTKGPASFSGERLLQ
jgi:hypothetical protein